MNFQRACMNCGTKYFAEPNERCCSPECRLLLEEKEIRLDQLRNEHSRLIDEEWRALDAFDMDAFEILAAELTRVRGEFYLIFGGIAAHQSLPSADDIIH